MGLRKRDIYKQQHKTTMKKSQLRNIIKEEISKVLRENEGAMPKPASNDTLTNGFTINPENESRATSEAWYIEALVADFGKTASSFRNTPTNRNRAWTLNQLMRYYYDIKDGTKETYNTQLGPDGYHHLTPETRAEILGEEEYL